MIEFLKKFPFVDVIITNGLTTYIECNVEVDRAIPMLEDLRLERVEIYLSDEGNYKCTCFAEDVP